MLTQDVSWWENSEDSDQLTADLEAILSAKSYALTSNHDAKIPFGMYLNQYITSGLHILVIL